MITSLALDYHVLSFHQNWKATSNLWLRDNDDDSVKDHNYESDRSDSSSSSSGLSNSSSSSSSRSSSCSGSLSNSNVVDLVVDTQFVNSQETGNREPENQAKNTPLSEIQLVDFHSANTSTADIQLPITQDTSPQAAGIQGKSTHNPKK